MIVGILVVLVVGTVTARPLSIFNTPLKFGLCKNPAVHPGFQVEKFFHDKWYSWKNTGNFFLGTNNSCSAFESKVDGETIHILHYQYEPMFHRYISLRGESDKELATFEGLRFPVKFQLHGGFTFTIPFSVVGTDYDNWAYVYFCRQLLFTKIEMSWILLRDKNASPTEGQLSEIEASLSTINSRMEDFEAQDNSHCGNGEPKF